MVTGGSRNFVKCEGNLGKGQKMSVDGGKMPYEGSLAKLSLLGMYSIVTQMLYQWKR